MRDQNLYAIYGYYLSLRTIAFDSATLSPHILHMKIKAAVAWKPNEPLSVEEIDLEGPKTGEVLVKIIATGVCHTDAFTLSGADPEGLFPVILGQSAESANFVCQAKQISA